MNEPTPELDVFIENPTSLSKKIITIALKKKREYDSLLENHGFFSHIMNGVKIRLWYLSKYNEIYSFLSNYKVKATSISGLFNEFESMCSMIALNNLLLMYAYLVEKDAASNIITREDEKMAFFNRLYHKEISIDEFNAAYGHYSLNDYELAAPRFCEYSKPEILKLSKFAKDFSSSKTIKLKDYIESENKRLFPVYCALREELRYHSLFIIMEIRTKLLELSKAKKIKNIFDIDYDKLMVL
jgi:hypothetical protein